MQAEKWDLAELTATIARRTLLPFVMVFALYAGSRVLDIPQRLLTWFSSIAMAALIMQLTLWANSLVDFF